MYDFRWQIFIFSYLFLFFLIGMQLNSLFLSFNGAWNYFYTTKCARTLVRRVVARLAGHLTRSGAVPRYKRIQMF